MLIIWGRGEGRSLLGRLKARRCPACGELSSAYAVLEYAYHHILFVISWIAERKYTAVCAHCNSERPLDKTRARLLFPEENIPFLRKNGWWMVALVLLALLIGSAVQHGGRASGDTSPGGFDRTFSALGP